MRRRTECPTEEKEAQPTVRLLQDALLIQRSGLQQDAGEVVGGLSGSVGDREVGVTACLELPDQLAREVIVHARRSLQYLQDLRPPFPNLYPQPYGSINLERSNKGTASSVAKPDDAGEDAHLEHVRIPGFGLAPIKL